MHEPSTAPDDETALLENALKQVKEMDDLPPETRSMLSDICRDTVRARGVPLQVERTDRDGVKLTLVDGSATPPRAYLNFEETVSLSAARQTVADWFAATDRTPQRAAFDHPDAIPLTYEEDTFGGPATLHFRGPGRPPESLDEPRFTVSTAVGEFVVELLHATLLHIENTQGGPATLHFENQECDAYGWFSYHRGRWTVAEEKEDGLWIPSDEDHCAEPGTPPEGVDSKYFRRLQRAAARALSDWQATLHPAVRWEAEAIFWGNRRRAGIRHHAFAEYKNNSRGMQYGLELQRDALRLGLSQELPAGGHRDCP